MTAPGRTESQKLSILLLGPPVVTLNDQLVKINRRELRAGLFYLAGHTEPVSRIEICDTFWPDDSEHIARKKLREGLSRLRSILGDPEIIIANNDQVSLDPKKVYVDGREYTELVTPILNSSEFNANGVLPEWLFSRLQKAMALCRGHQFLQNIALHNSGGFENWVNLNNRSFSFSRDKIIERLAGHCIALGNIDDAIIWLGKIITVDHLNTDINYLMVNCMLERRRFREALDLLDFLEPIYKAYQPDGLPVVLRDIRERILREQIRSKRIEKADWPGAELNAVTFVGRNDLLTRLNNAFYRKGMVYVTGESGSGKNRLVQEFYTRLESQPRLIFCNGKPMISSSPFAPIIEGLQSIITDKDWAALPEQIRSELKSYFLELTEVAPNTSSTLKPSGKSLQSIYDAILTLLNSLFAKQNVFMVIDIAKWCDDATLNLLTFLREQRFFQKHGLLVLISRSEDHNSNFNAFIDRSILTNDLEKIEVQPFSLEETAQLITAVMGRPVSDELVEIIQNDTGGNPFFLIETLRAINLYDFDPVQFKKTDLYPIPATIQSMVREKVQVLSAMTQKVLLSAAVLGKRFLPEVVEAMIDIDNNELIIALEELQQKSILIGGSGLSATSYYEFPHDQVREVILQGLSPARKRSLHLAAVKALLSVKGEAPELASTYAYHYDLAGEKTKSFISWCSAGRYAQKCFSRDDAYAAYQHALDLLHVLPPEEFNPLIRQLLTEWGDYAYDLYDDLTCEKLFKLGLEYGETRQDPLLIGISISGLGRVAEMRQQVDEGIELHNRALFFLANTDNKTEKLETYTRLGILYELKDENVLAEKAFHTGLSIEKDFSNMRALDAAVNLQTQLAILYCLMGKPGQAEMAADRAVNESLLINRLSGRVHAYTALAMAQYYTGKYKKSLQNAISVYNLADQLNLDWWSALLDFVMARNYLIMGQLDECWHHVEHAIHGKDPHLLHKTILHSYAIKGDLYRLMGDYPSAEKQYRLGVRLPLSDHQSLENYSMLGLMLCQSGRITEGTAALKEAIEVSERLGFESVSLFARIMLTAWTLPENNIRLFNEQTEPVVKLMKERGYGASWNAAEIVKGKIALQRGETAQARSIFMQVSEFSQKNSNCWNELWALNALAAINDTSDTEREELTGKIQTALNKIGEHATQQPVVQLFHQFCINMMKTQ